MEAGLKMVAANNVGYSNREQAGWNPLTVKHLALQINKVNGQIQLN